MGEDQYQQLRVMERYFTQIRSINHNIHKNKRNNNVTNQFYRKDQILHQTYCNHRKNIPNSSFKNYSNHLSTTVFQTHFSPHPTNHHNKGLEIIFFLILMVFIICVTVPTQPNKVNNSSYKNIYVQQFENSNHLLDSILHWGSTKIWSNFLPLVSAHEEPPLISRPLPSKFINIMNIIPKTNETSITTHQQQQQLSMPYTKIKNDPKITEAANVLLKRLGIGKKPRIRSDYIRIPEYLVRLYRIQLAKYNLAIAQSAKMEELLLDNSEQNQTTLSPMIQYLIQSEQYDDIYNLPMPNRLHKLSENGANQAYTIYETDVQFDPKELVQNEFSSYSRYIHYNTSTLPPNLVAAEIRFYLYNLFWHKNTFVPPFCFNDSQLMSYRLDLYQVLSRENWPTTQTFINNTLNNKPLPPKKFIDVKLVDSKLMHLTNAFAWESFDVTQSIEDWSLHPDHNKGFILDIVPNHVKCFDVHHSKFYQSNHSHASLTSQNQTVSNSHAVIYTSEDPFLLTFHHDPNTQANSGKDKQGHNTHVRSKRNIKTFEGSEFATMRKHRRKYGPANCRRHPLYVDFSDVGWNDWIVAPPGYHAFFCGGDCPFPLSDHLNSTNHAIIQTLVNSVNRNLAPTVCCVATELSPISMLYLDEYEKVVLKNYQDMVAVGCGCR